jgi:hypothetical protein
MTDFTIDSLSAYANDLLPLTNDQVAELAWWAHCQLWHALRELERWQWKPAETPPDKDGYYLALVTRYSYRIVKKKDEPDREERSEREEIELKFYNAKTADWYTPEKVGKVKLWMEIRPTGDAPIPRLECTST